MIINPAARLQKVSEYYFSKKLQQIATMQKSGLQVINLGIGSPDLMPSEATIEELHRASERRNAHGYQSYKGIPELRKAIADWYKKTYGVSLNPENQILPLIGSKEGIMHISMAFLDPGDTVLVPNPGYPTYTSVSNLAQANILNYALSPENNWKIDFNQLQQTDLSRVKIMWINYPHMPTGTKPDEDTFFRLVELAKQYKFLLVNDNPYSLILNDRPLSLLSADEKGEVTLELNSLSKSHNMAGWRIGWVAGREDYISTILQFKSNMDSGMFYAMQQAACKAFENPPEWHEARNQVYARRKKAVRELLDILDCTCDENQAGLFQWAKVPDTVPDVEEFVEDILQNALVFITPGFIFGSNGSRYIRISLCSDIAVYQEAANRISEWKKNKLSIRE